jgi:arabinose-5-phosphate isomerase
MSSPLKIAVPFSQFDQIREAREIIRAESEALNELSQHLDTRFSEAVEYILDCRGRVIITGIGKAGLIGQKIAATLSSTGTRAHFMHPTEAVHGDLGCIGDGDVVLMISNSGETEEVCRLIPIVHQLGALIIAITASGDNSLARCADTVLEIGKVREAGELGLAPSTSTTAMLAMGDALALVVSRMKSFTPRNFGVFHPGGSLGKRLTPIREVMRCDEELRIAVETETIRETLQRARLSGRRTGAILVINAAGELSGLFTDSDLARLLEQRRDEQLDLPISDVMTKEPTTIRDDLCLNDALMLLTEKKISELPVVNDKQQPLGLIDITDVIGISPDQK